MRAILLLLLLLPLGRAFCQPGETLIYHPIVTDKEGNILPWYDPDPAIAYDHNLYTIWNFWDTMRRDMNGLPYYMNHQVWNPRMDDPRGIGGDQFMMALSSWRLLYAYTGNDRIKENMSFLAGYYLTHGLSSATCKWPNIPFPYNTLIYSGIYDGDTLFLAAAIKIAGTLAEKVIPGDEYHSPLPFKINVYTGKPVLLKMQGVAQGKPLDTAGYTTNLTPTLQLFTDLQQLKKGHTAAYKTAAEKILSWLKKYPIQNNRWGPFFEDVAEWSETQINAMTCARFMMEHPALFPEWREQVRRIIEWVHTMFNNTKWKSYGVTVTNEQTVYPQPGNSHSARQAADELLYCSLAGDTTGYTNALRELNWATYPVDFDGKNCFPFDEPWLTDGYGDYVRHYLRAMDTYPQLAPAADHILSSTSVVQQADYRGWLKKYIFLGFENVDSNKVRLFYRTFDPEGTERIRLKEKPGGVLLNNKPMAERPDGEGYTWVALEKGGLLTVRRKQGDRVIVTD